MHSSRTKGLSRLQDLRDYNEFTGAEMAEASQRFECLAEPSSSPRVVSARELYPTPPDLAVRLVELAKIKPGMKALEPSAGTGVIADALKAAGADVVCCEIERDIAESLALCGHKCIAGDFLERFQPGDVGVWERVVMNPPFSAQIEHVQHAWKLLKPGGRLVAIMSEGPFFRSDRKAAAFRNWLEAIGGESEQLPPGTFKPSGTDVNARIVWASK